MIDKKDFRKINIAISGYGKMGHIVEKIAKKRGHEVVSIVDPVSPDATHKNISVESTKDADVIIEFSVPSAAFENVKRAVGAKKNMVIATTGWNEKIDEAKKIVDKNIGFIFAPNFSLGVNLFSYLLEKATKIFDPFDDYDVLGYEFHHKRKVDSPSGTAFLLGEKIIQNSSNKKKIVTEKLDRKIENDELHLASVRGGDIPGTHGFIFDSSFDSIEIKHTARNREGFALGAVLAAEWLKGKKGFFTVNDWLEDIL